MPDAREVLLVLDDICRHLDGDVSLTGVADRSGWSAHHLHRALKRVAGETLKQYTQRLRLERAAAALLASEDSVLDIAVAAGFQSHEVFARAFRRSFGCSPSAYRKRPSQPRARIWNDGHRALVDHVGPCIHLHRMPFHGTPTPEKYQEPMSEVHIREQAEQPILYVEAEVATTKIGEVLAQILPRVYGHCQTNGIALAGPPFVRYPRVELGRVTLQGGMPLAVAVTGEGDIVAGALTGGRVAVLIHRGPYDQLADSHAALGQWLADEAHEARGPRWESYLTDPGTTPNPADWQTEVIAPIA